MKLIKTIRDSIYNPLFYKSLLSTPLKSSIKFFYKLVAILALVGAILVIPKLMVLSNPETYQKILNAFPQQLQVVIQNGKVTTNVTEPFFIKDTLGLGVENLVVIDTKTEFSPSQFDQYKTNVILKSEYLVTQEKNNNRIQLIPFRKGNVIINYQVLQTWAGKLQSLAKYFIPIIVLFTIIALIIAHSFKLLYLFFAALLVLLLAKILKKTITYKKSYQIALHAMVLPMLLQFIFVLFGITSPVFIPTIILLVIAWLNIKDSVPPTGTIGVTPTVIEK
jgi:hypothetical protein